MFSQLSKLTVYDIIHSLKLIVALLIYPFTYSRYKGVWLMCERENNAQDNGWIFFNWLRKEHPEKKVYFVLGATAIGELGLSSDAHVIEWGSVKHYVIYLSASLMLKAMFTTPRPSGRVCYYYERLFGKHPKIVYLRHGISKDGLEHHLYEVQKVRLFICGAKPEYEYIKKYAGYPEGYVQYTGFARFDDLLKYNTDNRFVLFIPTWRRYLISDNLSSHENEQVFRKSSFYKHVSSILSNKSFITYLEERGYKLKFCIHAEFRRFSHLFSAIDPRVEVVNPSESIHKLLMSTSLLITDYSSVFFDVAYMHKPMLFYQFDYEEFRNKHFSEGYFSYEHDAMGPIVSTEIELVAQIKSLYDGERFINKDDYIDRCNRFFPVRDMNNCTRIYQAICDIEK